ncbi:MAG: dTDP-4-dehydrorhamnose reductase [Rubricoccaceae bacterium]
MKLLVTGAGGQVGRALVRAARAGNVHVVALDRASLDVTRPMPVAAALRAHAPDVLVNAAAYTAVDRAEAEPEAAFAANRDGPDVLARACARAGIPLLHLSTDYVFDGRKGAPYVPADAAAPLSVYGASKWAGEEAVRAHAPQHLIVRTAWLFSGEGRNFVRTILRLARERDTLRVVADQVGHPTPADALAEGLLVLARRAAAGDAPWGTYHLAGTPATTWHALAETVLAEARRHAPLVAQAVEPIRTAAYPAAARRPMRVELDQRATGEAFGVSPPDWREGVRRTVSYVMKPSGSSAG